MRPIRVLVVDDALFMRAMIREVLAGSGHFEVIGEAGTGYEAVDLYQQLRPDLVTMDLVMPGIDGIEATRRILLLDPAASIVVASALGQESLVIESIAAGAKDFLVKPFTAELVLKTLENVMDAA